MSKKKFLIASLSALVQYYDYHLFSFLAASIAKNFFSDTDLLKTYFLIFVAALTKPIGAIILGRIGDIYGRQKTINIGIIVTAGASLAISILPSFEQIGIMAPLILLLMRMCVTSCVSSGTDGVRIYIFETIGKTRKNLSSGLSTLSTILGSFLASTSAYFFTLNIFPNYFWRLAFLAGAVAGVLVIILRTYMGYEDDKLEREDNYEQYRDMPLWQIIRENMSLFVLGIIIAGGIGATYQFNFIFLSTYNSETLQNISTSDMQFYRSIGVFLYMVFAIISGLVADIISPRILTPIAILGVIVLSIFNCYLISQNITSIAIFLLNSVLLPFITMPSLTLIKASVPKVIRHRLFSLIHSIGSIVISAPTPFISTMLYQQTKVHWLPMVYFVLVLLLMLISINVIFTFNKVHD
jgi:MFS family permease